MSNIKNKVIVIIGPTASGKTSLAVKIAYKFQGEIISADSRQVFKYMDIGTGKDLAEYKFTAKEKGKLVKVEIPYHLIDEVSPNTNFDLAKFQHKALKRIAEIHQRGKLPIVAGGTGLYTQALVDGFQLSSAKPNKEIRKELEKKSAKELLKTLKGLGEDFAESLNESERNNRRRLIRYIEIRKTANNFSQSAAKPKFDFLILGINWPREVLKRRIYRRLLERLEKEDLIGEVERLHQEHKVSWKRLENFGLEYRFISQYLQGKLEYPEMVAKLNIAIGQFAKRQASWYRRWQRQGAKIHWLCTQNAAYQQIRKFLNK